MPLARGARRRSPRSRRPRRGRSRSSPCSRAPAPATRAPPRRRTRRALPRRRRHRDVLRRARRRGRARRARSRVPRASAQATSPRRARRPRAPAGSATLTALPWKRREPERLEPRQARAGDDVGRAHRSRDREAVREQRRPTPASAMRFIMMVEMTSCAAEARAQDGRHDGPRGARDGAAAIATGTAIQRGVLPRGGARRARRRRAPRRRAGPRRRC